MDYTSADFKVQCISSYTLYVNSDWVNDQIVVLDSDNKVLLARLYDSHQPAQEVAKILSLPFLNVYITLPHQRLIWTPSEAFQQGEAGDYRSFFDTDDQLWSKEIPSLGVTALYQYDLLLYNRWKRIFPNASFAPVFDVTVQQVQPQVPIGGAVLGVYVYDRFIDLFLFIDGEFQFYNTFEIATVDDLSYFVLQLFKSFQIDGRVQKVLLGGVSLESIWAKRLELYSEDIQLIKPKTRWTLDPSVTEASFASKAFHVMADSKLCAL